MHLETLNGQLANILGLAGSRGMDTSCAAIAFEAGVNYFFFYDLSHENLLNGLKPIVASHREQVLMATGSDERSEGRLGQYLEQVRQYLDVDVVDVFFAEYVTPSENIAQIWAVLDELWDWKERGLIRYVGATTHNRALALDLIKSRRCEVLMHHYNMAHRKAEEQLFPRAPQTQAQLEKNLSVLQTPELTPEAVARWQEYGALIYGDGQDAFETQWL